MSEDFKPISVKPIDQAPLRFRLRCLGDLQLLTIHRFLRPRLARWHGHALDVGAGEAPWRTLMGNGTTYQGVDTQSAAEFGMTGNADIVYYAGDSLPFESARFDHVLCTEVLEHVPDPGMLLGEISRVLKPGGGLVITVPWSARLHHIPHDYARYSHHGLEHLLSTSGFEIVAIEPRGNDYSAIANKLLIALLRLLRLDNNLALLLTLPCALLLAPLVAAALLVAHLSMSLGLGSGDDPLGYGVEARRR